MRTRTSPVVRLILALAVAGCAGDGTVASLAPQGAAIRSGTVSAAGGATADRPWTGQCEVDAEFTGPTTVMIVGTCQLAHLGRTTVVTQETLAWETATSAAFTNSSTYTAANGDLLYTTGSGEMRIGADGTATVTGTFTAIGGTGRFSNASGTAAYAESVRLTSASTAAGTYTLDGRLAY